MTDDRRAVLEAFAVGEIGRMARSSPILRGALAGSALSGVMLVRYGSLGNLVARWRELDAYCSDRDEDDDSFGAVWILVVPAVGAGFGVTCAVATRLLPIPP